MNSRPPFESLYAHGFVLVAVGTPQVELASPAANAARTLKLAQCASEKGAMLALFPELGLSGYSIDDLTQQDALLDAVELAGEHLIEASRTLRPMLIVGAPVRCEQKLFNCALIIHRGALLGMVPKSYLPNYREFYEKRQYSAAAQSVCRETEFAGQRAPFGADLLFVARNCPDFIVHAEICEDLWVPIPPSSYAALAGATILCNLSASNATVGKAEYRRLLCAAQSAKCIAAYLYAAANYGESTTDLAWDGHALIYENGERLAESRRFARDDGVIYADIDLDRLRQERMRTTSLAGCGQQHREKVAALRRIDWDVDVPESAVPLQRAVARFPYVPSDPATLDVRCEEVYQIQVQGLMRRLEATGIRKVVIGVSGGLDSAQALLVAVKTMDQLGAPRANVVAFALPGLATGQRTHHNAARLMHELAVTAQEIDIRPSVMQVLRDIGHPYASGEAIYDVTLENVQAGERASHLFRLANQHAALVLGTSDLSELALGYCTYGVGDQMSHYAVSASVPKTLVRHLLRWIAASEQFSAVVNEILNDILATPISPELVPETAANAPQDAQALVGPYELQDFNLYYLSRYGYRPSKVAFLAHHAWSDQTQGDWPALIPEAERHQYDLPTIVRWLEVFIKRFFETQQFKRSALPNGPKVGSGGSLSPRGDWRAPSDAHADAWLAELARNVPAG